jgi:hypothetical protein
LWFQVVVVVVVVVVWRGHSQQSQELLCMHIPFHEKKENSASLRRQFVILLYLLLGEE